MDVQRPEWWNYPLARFNRVMIPDSTSEPEPTVTSLTEGGWARIDNSGPPVEPPSMARDYLAVAGSLICVGFSLSVAISDAIHHRHSHIWYLGMLAGLTPIAWLGLFHSARQLKQLGIQRPKLLEYLLGAALAVGLVAAIICLAAGTRGAVFSCPPNCG